MARVTDEQARAAAERILRGGERLTVRRLSDEIGGDTGWLSMIVCQIKASHTTDTTDGLAPQETQLQLPDALRTAIGHLDRVYAHELMRVA